MERSYLKRRSSRHRPLTGADRRGIQGDLAAALGESREAEDPRVERPAAMIRALRYLANTAAAGPVEAMTAKAHALYEYLLAVARLEIVAKSEHRVSFADARAYLSVDRNDRIREYLLAMSQTCVSYDFRERQDGAQPTGRIPLLKCEEVPDERGNPCIAYALHPSIRQVILGAREYTHLEINAFARFRCKYSARLYPSLALVAGMTIQKPLVYTLEQLAAEIGWGHGNKVHFGHFETRCLKPMLDDFSLGLRRFSVAYELRRATTRGRPVEAIILTVSRSHKKLEEQKKVAVLPVERHRLRRHIEKSGLDRVRDTPNEELMAQAATVLEMTIGEISARWVEALLRARADPAAYLGAHRRNTGGYILRLLEQKGVGTAFREWLLDHQIPQCACYPVPGNPGVVATEKPVPELPDRPREFREVDRFEEARIVQFDLDESLPLETIETEILARVDRYAQWTGLQEKTLRFRWRRQGVVDCRDYLVPLGWADNSRFLHAFEGMLSECRWLG